MTDPLSERLEKAEKEVIEYISIASESEESIEMMAHFIVNGFFAPILRDEIAAAEEASLTEFLTNESVKVDGQALARHDAAVRERTLDHAINMARNTPFRCHAKDDVDFHSGCVQTRDGIIDALRALKTPQPEVLK